MKLLIFNILLLLAPIALQAQNRHREVLQLIRDSLDRDTSLTSYDRKVLKRYFRWSRLIPSQTILQNAGNMGVVSMGIGWDYGKREQWETHLLFGLIPKHDSRNAKLTMTIKETYRPWQISLGKDFYFDPLTCGLYLNTAFDDEFWSRQPDRYPKSYYDFLSTKVRINIFLGQQIDWKIPYYKRKSRKSVTLFYEVSTCDLYLRSMITEKYVKLTDILGLSIGAKVKLF